MSGTRRQTPVPFQLGQAAAKGALDRKPREPSARAHKSVPRPSMLRFEHAPPTAFLSLMLKGCIRTRIKKYEIAAQKCPSCAGPTILTIRNSEFVISHNCTFAGCSAMVQQDRPELF